MNEDKTIGVVGGYCNGENCQAREVEIHFKNVDGLAIPKLTCPLCRRPLDHVRFESATDHLARTDAEARRSVNVQRYIRDNGPAVPFGVFVDDTLPH